MMTSKEFTGRSSSMRLDTPWLAAEDLLDVGDVNVTIEKIYHHTGVKFDDGRKVDLYAIAFVNKSKQLVLNTTNRKTLVSLFGTDVSKWKQQTITLYVDPHVAAFGKEVCGIRIRSKLLKQSQANDDSAQVAADLLSRFVADLNTLETVEAVRDALKVASSQTHDEELFLAMTDAAEAKEKQLS